MDAVLHITNGDGAAGVMRQAEFDGDILPWRDVLHEGPVQAHLPLAELSHIRARFIADKGWGTFEEVAAAFAARDHLLQASADSDRVVLWFEHDLFDQLQLLQLLAWCAAHDRGKARLDLLCIGDFPGVADFGGLGELTPAQMASLRGRERPVTEAQLELGRIGFQAFGADDPERLAAFLRRDLSSLPFLRGAHLIGPNADLRTIYKTDGARNVARMRDAELDRMIDAQAAELKDMQRRRTMLHQIQRRIIEFASMAPMYSEIRMQVSHPVLQGVVMNTESGDKAMWEHMWLDR